MQQSLLKDLLLQRGLDIRGLALENVREPEPWWAFSKDLIAKGTGIRHLSKAHIVLLCSLAALSIGAGIWLRRKLLHLAHRLRSDTFASQLIQAGVASVAHYLPGILLFGVFSMFMGVMFSGVRPPPFIALLSYSLLAFTLVLATIRTILHPVSPAKLVAPLPDELAHSMARRLMVLALLGVVGVLLFMTLLSKSLPEHALDLAHGVYVTVLVVNAAWLIWLIGKIPALAGSGRGIRFVLLLLLLVILGAEWLGYRNLSDYLVLGLAGTVVAIAAFWVVNTLFSEFFYGLEGGEREWQKRLRAQLGFKAEEPIPGLNWLRLLMGLIIWGALGLVLLRVWGLSDAGFALIFEYAVDGFKIGNITIVPSKVLTGLIVFALLLTATGWFKNTLEHTWARRAKLDVGAREAVVTMTGYVGFIVAALIGLSLAGVKFQNVAIIAGALSVGIGFGLQTVVNNFVSGIILLFERPIRTGDYVVVGNTQGWVKKIRVRATEIQTPDREDVVVPNSELVSTQVSNRTLRDPHLRIIIPVGVAYGSDTQLVKKLLLKVAKAHPQVLSQGPALPPQVFFLAFGDSALSFELRCFIRNAAYRLDVISDLHFEIDRAFRENGIQIPFPQRDLHLHTGFAGSLTREDDERAPRLRAVQPRPEIKSGDKPDSD